MVRGLIFMWMCEDNIVEVPFDKEYLYVMKGKCQLTVCPKSKTKMKSKLNELTRPSSGWGYAKRKQKLKDHIRGWNDNYHLANMICILLLTNESINAKHMNGVLFAKTIGE